MKANLYYFADIHEQPVKTEIEIESLEDAVKFVDSIAKRAKHVAPYCWKIKDSDAFYIIES